MSRHDGNANPTPPEAGSIVPRVELVLTQPVDRAEPIVTSLDGVANGAGLHDRASVRGFVALTSSAVVPPIGGTCPRGRRGSRLRRTAIALLALALSGCGFFGAPELAGIHARMGYSDRSGLRVVEVPEGPARIAGLQVGDRVLAIDGEPIGGRDMEDVVESLRGPVGTVVELEVLREGRRVALEVTRMPYERRSRRSRPVDAPTPP